MGRDGGTLSFGLNNQLSDDVNTNNNNSDYYDSNGFIDSSTDFDDDSASSSAKRYHRELLQREQQHHQQQQQQHQQQPSTLDRLTDIMYLKKKKSKAREKNKRKSYYLSTWLFLKILSTVFFIAFFSSYIQVQGLIGDEGILPVSKLLESKSHQVNSIWILFTHPTKGFGFSANTVLHLLCVFGLAFSALSLFTTSHATYIGFMWFFYYCIVDVGQLFYSYQWDQLLLETAFLAIFISPFNFKYDEKPSTPIRYLLKWLTYRLIFGSGIVKLSPVWSSLQAMNFHYETQCIPNIFSYYVHQLPYGYHQFETLMVLVIEILIPPFFFAPRPFKIAACIVNILLQLLIILTGNYNFFNYLAIALLLTLLDDSFILKIASFILPHSLYQHMRGMEHDAKVRRRYSERSQVDRFTLNNIDSKNLLIPFVFILVGMSSLYSSTRYLTKNSLPTLVHRVHTALDFYHITGTYGLFSTMTTQRFEITIEGSYDGTSWFEYEFYYKPGNLSRAPPIVFPGHNPRLDWQMWFAAINNDPRTQGWLIHFMARLLQGSPEVLSLIDYSPFPLDSPPKYIRAQKYLYKFTKLNRDQKDLIINGNDNNNNDWWTREYQDVYVRPFALDSPSYLYFKKLN